MSADNLKALLVSFGIAAAITAGGVALMDDAAAVDMGDATLLKAAQAASAAAAKVRSDRAAAELVLVNREADLRKAEAALSAASLPPGVTDLTVLIALYDAAMKARADALAAYDALDLAEQKLDAAGKWRAWRCSRKNDRCDVVAAPK